VAGLRNIAITISRLAGHKNIAAARGDHSWTPRAAIDAVIAT